MYGWKFINFRKDGNGLSSSRLKIGKLEFATPITFSRMTVVARAILPGTRKCLDTNLAEKYNSFIGIKQAIYKGDNYENAGYLLHLFFLHRTGSAGSGLAIL